jgi:hypothetical protein
MSPSTMDSAKQSTLPSYIGHERNNLHSLQCIRSDELLFAIWIPANIWLKKYMKRCQRLLSFKPSFSFWHIDGLHTFSPVCLRACRLRSYLRAKVRSQPGQANGRSSCVVLSIYLSYEMKVHHMSVLRI